MEALDVMEWLAALDTPSALPDPRFRRHLRT